MRLLGAAQAATRSSDLSSLTESCDINTICIDPTPHEWEETIESEALSPVQEVNELCHTEASKEDTERDSKIHPETRPTNHDAITIGPDIGLTQTDPTRNAKHRTEQHPTAGCSQVARTSSPPTCLELDQTCTNPRVRTTSTDMRITSAGMPRTADQAVDSLRHEQKVERQQGAYRAEGECLKLIANLIS